MRKGTSVSYFHNPLATDVSPWSDPLRTTVLRNNPPLAPDWGGVKPLSPPACVEIPWRAGDPAPTLTATDFEAMSDADFDAWIASQEEV